MCLVDGKLERIFAEIGLSSSARRDMLQLRHETREALVKALQGLGERREFSDLLEQ